MSTQRSSLLALRLAAISLIVAVGPLASAGTPPVGGPNTGRVRQGKYTAGEYDRASRQQRSADQLEQRIRRREGIIRKLRVLASSGRYDKQPQVLFRLAEALRTQAFDRWLLALDDHERALACYEEKRCKKEPQEPTPQYGEAIATYRKLLRTYPTYARVDEVRFYLGRETLAEGKRDGRVLLIREGVARLEELIRKHPDSHLVPQARLLLAEHYFDINSLYYAKIGYETILRQHPKHQLANYAEYKLAWVHYNLADFDKTLEAFQRVVAASRDAAGRAIHVEFREQALNDMLLAWAELPHDSHQVLRYYTKQVGRPAALKKLVKLGRLLKKRDVHERALAVFRHLARERAGRPELVEHLGDILEVTKASATEAVLDEEILRAAERLTVNGPWHGRNQHNAQALVKARELISGWVLARANHYHRVAEKAAEQKQRAKAQQARRSALVFYAELVKRYPDHPKVAQVRLLSGELLYESGKMARAAEQYEAALTADPNGPHAEAAALGAAFAREALMPPLAVGKVASPLKPKRLSPAEARFVEAADRYAQVTKRTPKGGAAAERDDLPEVMFAAAHRLYQRGQVEPAVKRFAALFDRFPEHPRSADAGRLAMAAAQEAREWPTMARWAERLLTIRPAGEERAKTVKSLAYAQGETARALELLGRHDAAIEVYRALAERLDKEDKELAAGAVYAIGRTETAARRYERALAAYEETIRRFPNTKAAADALFHKGVIYESQTRFTEAADTFHRMGRFGQTARTPDALKNAGLLYEALGRYDEATAAFERYAALFRKLPDAPTVALHRATVIVKKGAYLDAARAFEHVATLFGRKQRAQRLRALALAGVAYKKADKERHRPKVQALFRKSILGWRSVGNKVDPVARRDVALAAFEMAEYAFDDFNRVQLEALREDGRFDGKRLARTLEQKTRSLKRALGMFDKVLALKSPEMVAAAAFRKGQIVFDYSEALRTTPPPPGLTPEEILDYQDKLRAWWEPLQETALEAFAMTLRYARDNGVYNRWSRLSAQYVARLDPDSYPVARSDSPPMRTRDIVSPSFIRRVKRGTQTIDFRR